MTTKKKIGIWMDHASAHVMEYSSNPSETRTIASKFTHQAKEHIMGKGEFLMHNKEQHQQSEYYHKIAEIISHYDDVILFGPTDAKTELYNVLKEDHLFSEIKFEIKQSGKMTENQQHAFVREHFAKH